MITGGADEAARPSQPFQVVQAICISREPSPKLPKRLRVVNAGMGTFHCPSLAQLRLNGYPRHALWANPVMGSRRVARRLSNGLTLIVIRFVPITVEHAPQLRFPHRRPITG